MKNNKLVINFLGDSITEGCWSSKPELCFVSLVGKMLGAEVRNYGIGGTRFAKQRIPSWNPKYDQYFASRIPNMNHDADLLFVFGGTNDFGHGDAPIGEEGDNTPNTFIGATNNLVEELLKHYKKEQITFILPLHRMGENNVYGNGEKETPSLTLDGYVSIIKDIVSKNEIDILDVREEMGGGICNPLLRDGLHPNDLGHRKLAELICDYIKNKKFTK